MNDFAKKNITPSSSAPIGVFDSGLGGVSVLRELKALLPNEDYIYIGDTAHVPYGDKTYDQIREFGLAVGEQLTGLGVKAIVIACNTATSASAAPMRELYPDIPIIGIEPALKPAAEKHPGGNVVVMATPLTLKLDKFAHLLEACGHLAHVELLPCHGLADLIEQGKIEGPEVMELFEKLYAEAGIDRSELDAVVLGCTHYPFVEKALNEFLGNSVELFDGSEGTARQLKHLLEEKDLLTDKTSEGSLTFMNTAGDPTWEASARFLFEM